MTDFVYEDSFDPQVNIKVVGVGGGGGNALDCMVQADVKNIEYIDLFACGEIVHFSAVYCHSIVRIVR